jgi:O-methyltransferase
MSFLKNFAKKRLPRLVVLINKVRFFNVLFFHGVIRYNEDELITAHKCEFLNDEKFTKAFRIAVDDGLAVSDRIRWRAHTACWAATHALNLNGDFIECGTNKGFLAKIIIDYLDLDRRGKKFYLLDTYQGFDEKYLNPIELANGKRAGGYAYCYDFVLSYFSKHPCVRIIKGSIPETLPSVESKKVAFIHIDLNCVIPEIASINYFWDKLVTGGVVLLDDYGHAGHEQQQLAFDSFAKEKSTMVLALPTGQGLLIKP